VTRKLFIFFLTAGWLAACSSVPRTQQSPAPKPPETKTGGGYYLDDGPGDAPPPNLQAVPDAVPREELLHRYANRPYEVSGVSYTPVTERQAAIQTGIASWYGKRFHGKPTSSGEIYDMYGMTAAHPTLPIPSYAKVTSLDSGKSVIVRINDRGPFHSDRVIDLSYTAAYKLGLLGKGSGRVSVESIGPETEPVSLNASRDLPQNNLPTKSASSSPTSSRNNAADSGYYVQLGAFGNPDNAEKLLLRARQSLDIPVELVQVTLVGNLHRVKLGPFSNQAEASNWVEKTRAALGIAAITITR
jgi:rare lipoprotein A